MNFSLTGHSAWRRQCAVRRSLYRIIGGSFSAPSVMGSLTSSARRKAENGEFDSQIINYAHPGDIIASGTLGGYDRHVGSTYYIDSNYEDANEGVGVIDKIKNALGGPYYHGLKRYKFDENGYIENKLYDGETGEYVGGAAAGAAVFGRGAPGFRAPLWRRSGLRCKRDSRRP
ncbi:hypothetical protein VQ056_26245 [Paenibacillus sp. JTLBN-2024]